MRNDRAKEIETNFGATNFSYNPTKAWTLSGFAILSSSKTELETSTKNTILEPNSSAVATTENRTDISQQKNDLGLFKLSSSYKPNANFQLDYDILTRISAQRENNELYRQVFNYVSGINTDESVLTSKKQDPVNINQNLSFYYTPTDKHIFAFESQHLYQNEDPLYNANLEFQPFVKPHLLLKCFLHHKLSELYNFPSEH